MRRATFVLLVAVLIAVPLTAAGAQTDECPTISGSARLDYGRTLTGQAKVLYEDAKIKVDFVETSYTSTGDNTADITFDWFFPDGTVTILEQSTVTPVVGPLFTFDSIIDVTGGGEGSWTWSGLSNVAAGLALFEFEGTLCIGP